MSYHHNLNLLSRQLLFQDSFLAAVFLYQFELTCHLIHHLLIRQALSAKIYLKHAFRMFEQATASGYCVAKVTPTHIIILIILTAQLNPQRSVRKLLFLSVYSILRNLYYYSNFLSPQLFDLLLVMFFLLKLTSFTIPELALPFFYFLHHFPIRFLSTMHFLQQFILQDQNSNRFAPL